MFLTDELYVEKNKLKDYQLTRAAKQLKK